MAAERLSESGDAAPLSASTGGREVSCRLIGPLLDAIEQKGLALEDIAGNLPYPLSHLRNPNERIDWSHYVAFLRRANAEFDVEELDRLAADVGEGTRFRPFIAVARILYSPAEHYRWVAGSGQCLIRRQWRCVEPTLQEISPHHLILELRVPPEAPPPDQFFRGTGIALSRIPTLFGLGPAEVRREDIEGGARYEILLPRETGLLANLRRWILYPFAARHAAKELRTAHELLEQRYRLLRKEVDERARAERELSESRERYRRLTDNAQDVIAEMDEDGLLVYVSANVRDQLGFTSEELMRRLPETHLEAVHPDDRALFASFRSLAGNDEGVRAQYRLRHEDGDWRWFEASVRGFRTPQGETHTVFVAHDVTEQEEARSALRESETTFRELMENLEQVFFIMSRDGSEVHYVSPFYEELTGRSRLQVGTGFAEWAARIHPDDREALLAIRATLDPDDPRPGECEVRIQRPEGEWAWVHVRSFLIRDADGHPYRVGAVVEDVTDRKRAEAAAALSEGQLRLRADELARMDRAKDEFLAVLAHELRSPLSAISNACHLLEEGDAGDSQPLVATIRRRTDQLGRLVSDLLDVARLTSGRVEIRPERVDAREIVRSALEMLGDQIALRGQELTLELPANPVPIDADPLRLEQVVSNLLANATRYGHQGGSIAVSVATEGPDAVVRVSDDGEGIPAEDLPLLFRGPAPRGERARHIDGLGLGLRVVRELVELHGGSVHGASEGPGQGSEFTVRLPRAEGMADAPPTEAETPRTEPPRLVLVIEDDPDVAETLEQVLRQWGHDVHLARDGAGGVWRARTLKPEVVLVDVGLPDISGYDVARAIRADPVLDPELLVAITGYGRPQDLLDAKAAGFDDHLTKPDVLPRLRELLTPG